MPEPCYWMAVCNVKWVYEWMFGTFLSSAASQHLFRHFLLNYSIFLPC